MEMSSPHLSHASGQHGSAMQSPSVAISGKKETSKVALAGMCIVLTALAVVEKVSLKKATSSLPGFGVFLSEIVVLLFALVFSGVVGYKLMRTHDITRGARSFPKYKFALISICDTVAGILVLVPAGNVDGNIITLVLQGVLFSTLVGSVLIIGRRFHARHYVGAVIMLVGIALNTVPSFKHDAIDKAWYIIPLFISTVPAGLSGIFQEMALQGVEMDIYYYQYWIAVFQFVLGLTVSPLTFILSNPGENFRHFPSNVWDGLLCWLPGTTPSGLSHDDVQACHDSFWAILVYLVFVMAFNVAISTVVKHGSAVLMTICMTVAVPLQYFAFSIKIPFFVPDPISLSWWNVVGLVVALGGLIMYHLAPDVEAAQGAGGEGGARAGGGAVSSIMSPSMMRSPLIGKQREAGGSKTRGGYHTLDDPEADAFDEHGRHGHNTHAMRGMASEAPF